MTAPTDAERVREMADDPHLRMLNAAETNEALCAELDQMAGLLEDRIAEHDAYRNSAAAVEIALSARIDELEAALKPFADYYDFAIAHDWTAGIASDNSTPVIGYDDPSGETKSCTVDVGDFRRARAALQPIKVDHD